MSEGTTRSVHIRDEDDPTVPSPSDQFLHDGYLVVPQLLNADQVAAIRQDAHRALDDAPVELSRYPRHGSLVLLTSASPVVSTLLTGTPLLGRLRDAVGSGADDVRWVSGYVISKYAGCQSLPWHQDWWLWDDAKLSRQATPPQVAGLVYLDDTTDKGELAVLPGSHRRWINDLHPLLPEPHSADMRNVSEADPADRAHDDEVMLSLRAGDAVILDYRVLHRTEPNRTTSARTAIQLSFAPAFSSLPTAVRGHLARNPSRLDQSSEDSTLVTELLCTPPDEPTDDLDPVRRPQVGKFVSS